MSSNRQFFKYTALGNDYIVIDPSKFNLTLDTQSIKNICHRRLGVGSDGILYGPIFKEKTISVQIFNPDGSEAEKSGNGLRIFARYLKDEAYIKTPTFNLSTLGGEVSVEFLDKEGQSIKIHMGKRNFQSAAIPVQSEMEETVNFPLVLQEKEYLVTCVSMGNPHCVLPLPEISETMARQLGPLVENHPLFPQRTNVQFLKVHNKGLIEIEIWERGAGYTLASGSSSCAAAAVAFRLGLIDSKVKVKMPGGEIAIDLLADGGVWMTGGVKKICRGVLADGFMRP